MGTLSTQSARRTHHRHCYSQTRQRFGHRYARPRLFWILDDMQVLHQLAKWGKETVTAQPFQLFHPEPAYRMPGGGGRLGANAAIGENPSAGRPFGFI